MKFTRPSRSLRIPRTFLPNEVLSRDHGWETTGAGTRRDGGVSVSGAGRVVGAQRDLDNPRQGDLAYLYLDMDSFYATYIAS